MSNILERVLLSNGNHQSINFVQNPANMKNILPILIVLLISLQFESKAQTLPQSSILKIGGSGSSVFSKESNQYGLQVGLENSTKSHFFTNQVSAGYLQSDNDLYYLKFDYRFYPLSSILKNYRYQGLYFGLGPGMYLQETTPGNSEFGLAFFATAGAQLFVNNRIAVALEIEFNSISQTDAPMPDGKYSGQEYHRAQKPLTLSESQNSFHLTGSLKVGYLFNRPKSGKKPVFTDRF